MVGKEVEESLADLQRDLNDIEEESDLLKKAISQISLLFKFWSQYIQMVKFMLMYIRAERSGNWIMHLAPTASTAPHSFTLDRPNYSRWFPVYLADMNRLQEANLLVYQEFINGNHAVSRSTQLFAKVWTDMALEQTINLDSKTKVGIVGINKQPQALEHWFLTPISERVSQLFWKKCVV